MKNTLFTSIVFISLFFANTSAFAQKFVNPVLDFSGKKTSYLTKDDGTEITGNVKGIKWKKGGIKEIKMIDLQNKKVKIKPAEVKFMYLPPSTLSKLAQAQNLLYDATSWGNTDLKKDILKKGYVYYEKSDIRNNKKTFTLIMQLINPSFASEIKVYHDPTAKETSSTSIGRMKLAGGEAKSYYIKKAGDKVARILKKKHYKSEFKMLFSDCPSLIEKYGANPKWADLEQHIYEYTTSCE